MLRGSDRRLHLIRSRAEARIYPVEVSPALAIQRQHFVMPTGLRQGEQQVGGGIVIARRRRRAAAGQATASSSRPVSISARPWKRVSGSDRTPSRSPSV